MSVGAVLQSRYRIACELGTGGMGAVYEAVDQRLEATVALKETFSTDDRLRRQFEQEARLLAQLHHPCLPRVSDYFCESGRAFLVMQFISGPDLSQILAQQPAPFPRDQVIAWADQLLDALVYLHERDRQIIHRDIKPHNLKLMPNGRVALLDFGLAKAYAADQSSTNSSHSIFGYTRRYSPPEQIRDLGTTPQSDIYALGATLYHLLTGFKPPDSLERAAAVANSEPDPLGLTGKDVVDAELSGVLNKAMALNARDRFKSAKDFREALRRVGRREIAPSTMMVRVEKDLNSKTTMASRTLVDPFDSYAILRPSDQVFRLAEPGRSRAAALIAALAIALIAIVVAYPSGLMDSASGVVNSAPNISSREATGAAVVRQTKPENTTPRSSAIRSQSIGANGEINRRAESGKRRPSAPDKPKPRQLKPPRFSITP